MTDKQTKQAILGFIEFFKGITGNQNLEIPSEIAEKCGIQTQADGEYYNKDTIIEWLKAQDIIKTDGQEKEARKQLSELPSVTIPSKNTEMQGDDRWLLHFGQNISIPTSPCDLCVYNNYPSDAYKPCRTCKAQGKDYKGGE